MVADGAGAAWLVGRWKVIRLDPETGETSTWDAADDAVFASPELGLAPSAGAGVWLLDGDRIRLFDGHRFAVDLQVPEDMVNFRVDSGAVHGIVRDVVELGSELWLSLEVTLTTDHSVGPDGGQVVKWSDGRWAVMSQLAGGVGGDLAVDTDGSVWAGGSTSSLEGARGGIKRFDGSGWVLPGARGPEAPGASPLDSGHVVADPAGGVWFHIEGQGGHLFRFDRASWHSAGGDLLTPDSISGGLAASSGAAWLIGAPGIASFSADGTVRTFGPEQGLAQDVARLVVAGEDDVLVLDRQGVQRLDGNRFNRLWTDPDPPDWNGPWVARSADEIWAQSDEQWFRYHDGAWQPTGLTTGTAVGATVATDGALWISTTRGLVRRAKGGDRVMGQDEGDLFAGPDGSVWVSGDGRVIQYDADGTRTAIDFPGRTDGECLLAAGSDGSVWVSAEPEPGEGCGVLGSLARWDGRRWATVDAPPWTMVDGVPTEYMGSMVATDDGAAWTTSYSGNFLGRHHDGRWTSFDVKGLATLTAVPEGRVCGMERADMNSSLSDALVCFNREGEVARFDISGMGVGDISIAPDGSIWVKGGQFARLDETLAMK